MVRWTQDTVTAHEEKLAPKLEKPAEAFQGRESELQERIKADLRARRFYVIGSIFGKRATIDAGTPDIIAAGPNGVTLWIEVKVGKNKLSPEQATSRHVLLALGHRYLLIYGFEQYLMEMGDL